MFKSLILASVFILLFSSQGLPPVNTGKFEESGNTYFSPVDMAVDTAQNLLFVAGKTAHELRSYKLENMTSYTSYHSDLPPKAICLAGDRLLLACSHSEG